LVILDSDEEIDELNSNFLGFNNSKLRKLHSDLKEISKKAIASRVGKGEFHP
jgi:hypothetical protein